MDNWKSLIAARMRTCASMPRYEDARQENARNLQRNYKQIPDDGNKELAAEYRRVMREEG